MKVRLIMTNDDTVQILCANGTIGNASQSLLAHFFTHFNEIGIFSGSEGRWDQEYADMSEYPGNTLAYVTNDGRLLVEDPKIIEMAMTNPKSQTPGYISVAEYAKKYGRSQEIVKAYLRDGRIMGGYKMGRAWLIPEDAPYPVEEVSRKPDSGRFPRKR